MSLERAQTKTAPRCPWCHEGADPSGEGWVTCPHDRTPAHVECVREFGVCAICREPLDPDAAAEKPIVAAKPSRRAIQQGVFVRPRIGGKRFGIEALPGEVETQLAAIARDYRRHDVRWLAAAGWTVALFLELLLGALMVRNPGSEPLVIVFVAAGLAAISRIFVALRGPLVPGPPHVASLRWAKRGGRRAWALVAPIVANDQEALTLVQRHRLVVGVAEAAEAELERLEREPAFPDGDSLKAAAQVRGQDAAERARSLRARLLSVARESLATRASREALLPRGSRASSAGANKMSAE